MRYIAKMQDTFEEKEFWFKKAIQESPDRRESYVELASIYYQMQMWKECYENAVAAIQIEQKPLDYLCEEFAWGSQPYDYASISSFYLGNKDCVEYAVKALNYEPNNERLKDNLSQCINAFPA
jgi:hypothetical protein